MSFIKKMVNFFFISVPQFMLSKKDISFEEKKSCEENKI